MAKKKKTQTSDEAKTGDGSSLILRNRKAFHNYEITEKLECGMVLTGTEVKSLRDRNVSFADSYVRIDDDELFLVAINISEYAMGNRMNHEPTRKRKLLAHRRQIVKLQNAIAMKGMTLVPLRLFWHRGKAKCEIGVGRGKAQYDKRESLRNRELDREKQRIMRHRNR